MRWLLPVVLILAGCAKPGQVNAPPSSGYTELTVTVDAQRWADRAPVTRSHTGVVGTGSMLPLFGKNATLLLEYVTADQLTAGDIAIYERADGQRIVHRVMEVGSGAVLFSGDNNNASDGWVPKGAIRQRVAGILYATR